MFVTFSFYNINRNTLNMELFENAPPYMINRPSLNGGVYMSARQTSKFIFKLTHIHVKIFTN